METSHMDCLREYMRNDIDNCGVPKSEENVVSIRRPIDSKTSPGAAALDVVYQIAELIRDVDNYAAERHARAEMLAQQAIEKLKIAHDRVQSAESGRLAAEAEIKKFSERLEKELSVRLQDVEIAMEQTASRMAATEFQLSAAEQRARAAETRAEEAEDALRRIEEAVRTRILEKRRGGPSVSIATAA
jgi:exonuclease VII large subunit